MVIYSNVWFYIFLIKEKNEKGKVMGATNQLKSKEMEEAFWEFSKDFSYHIQESIVCRANKKIEKRGLSLYLHQDYDSGFDWDYQKIDIAVNFKKKGTLSEKFDLLSEENTAFIAKELETATAAEKSKIIKDLTEVHEYNVLAEKRKEQWEGILNEASYSMVKNGMSFQIRPPEYSLPRYDWDIMMPSLLCFQLSIITEEKDANKKSLGRRRNIKKCYQKIADEINDTVKSDHAASVATQFFSDNTMLGTGIELSEKIFMKEKTFKEYGKMIATNISKVVGDGNHLKRSHFLGLPL